MAFAFIVADRYITESINITATPQAVFTNSSTYTRASLVAAVTAEEISGNGYSRPNLTVSSNQVNSSGYGILTYATFTITASGGDIEFDRVALIADSDFVGYVDTGAQSIPDGSSKVYRLVFSRGQAGTIVAGNDGESAYTISTAPFTQPAASATVIASVENSGWLALNSIVFFQDGTNQGYYQVTAIGGANSITIENLNQPGDAVAGTTMLSGGSFVAAGGVGPGATIAVGTTSTLAEGESATVTNVGTSTAAILDFGIPKGDTGDTGPSGTIAVGTVNTLGEGESATVANSGTSTAAIFDFGLPRGEKGFPGFGLRYTFSTELVSPAASGELRLNSATSLTATEIYINSIDRNLAGVNPLIELFVPGTPLLVFDENDDTAWSLFTVSSRPSVSGLSYTIGVAAVATSGTLSGSVTLGFALKSEPWEVETVLASDTLSSDESKRYLVDCSLGDIVITLPLAASSVNVEHLIKRVDTSVNSLTIVRSGSDLIDLETFQVLDSLEAVHLRSDNVSNWWLF